MKDLLLNVGSGGGAAAAPTAGGSGGGGGSAPEAKEEEKKEEGRHTQHITLNMEALANVCNRKGRIGRGYGFRSLRLSKHIHGVSSFCLNNPLLGRFAKPNGCKVIEMYVNIRLL